MGSVDIPKPPSPARDFLRLVLAFSIAVSIGLAPFLGTLEIPGFTALLTLFPKLPWDTTRNVVPFVSFLMGVIAVLVQARVIHSSTAKKARLPLLVALILGLFVLIVTHTFTVRYIDVPATSDEVAVLVGFSRPSSCAECPASMSDAECLRVISLSPHRIESCWGDLGIRTAFLAILLPYLVVMSLFAVLVGYLPLGRRRPRRG